MPEAILLATDQVFRWEGRKRRQTLLSAKLGRLVLTSARLLFLSTGSHDVTATRVLRGFLPGIVSGGPDPEQVEVAMETNATSHLDFRATQAAGGLDIPIDQLRSAQ